MATDSITEGKVLNGPSKADLIFGLFDGKEVEFEFELDKKHRARMRISGVAREDGSSESWNINGWFPHSCNGWKYFNMYFDSRNRTGYIKVSDRYIPLG